MTSVAVASRDVAEVGSNPFDGWTTARAPLRVALAGCGAVGSALLHELRVRRDALEHRHGRRIELTSVLVQDLAKDRTVDLDRALLTADLDVFLGTGADVVIEAIGGIEPARRIAEWTLAGGRELVTANKELLAAHGSSLHALARQHGGTLRYDAAVGGGVPVLRLLDDALGAGTPVRVRGILNGTTNFVLGRLERGAALDDALAAARREGFAEEDASRDLDGRDAAAKIALVAWAAYGVAPESLSVERRSLLPDPARYVRLASRCGGVVRQVAECALVDGSVHASVEPVIVAPASALGRVRDEQNHVEVHTGWRAPLSASGPGAGGAPTATALLADFVCTSRAPARRGDARCGSVDSRTGDWAIEVAGSPLMLHRAVPRCGLVNTDQHASRAWTLARGLTASEVDAVLASLAAAGGEAIAARLDPELRADDGECTEEPEITCACPAYELTGRAGAPVVLALGGISATRHVLRTGSDPSPGWWDGVCGPSRALDPDERRILGVDFLDGGCSDAGTPARFVSTHDQAAAIAGLLDTLGIGRLDAVVGASYGGMVALALAERWPERVRRLVVIGAAHEAYPMSTALRSVQRTTVELGLRTGEGREAMIIARALAMTTYRSAREFAERFPAGARESCTGGAPASRTEGASAELEVERYLRRSGERFAEQMTPARFLALSLSADLHRVTPERVTVPTTLIAAQGDTLVPPSQMRELAARLPNLRGFHTLRSRRGHDAFLTETGRLSRLLTTILD